VAGNTTAPRQILDAARYNTIESFTSVALLAEMEEVLHREKFARRLRLVNHTPDEFVSGYASLATVVKSAVIMPVVLADPDDDAVLSCAVAACAEAIISGDRHLLNLKEYQGIHIITVTEASFIIGKK
jgi:putative PIN family toxin of toxin-antitoxin system